MRAILWGAGVGTVVFGIGGRGAMRVYALLDYQEPYFTASGTLTVVLIAAAAGAALGAWWWLAQRLLASHRIWRQVFFWAGLLLLTARILQPISLQRVQVFAPLVALYGVLLPVASRARRRPAPASAVEALAD